MIGGEVSFIIPFGNRPRDWTSQELAEFYRVESALIQGGMRIVTDRGLSDDGDPWFVFCREDDGEPVVHFARIDGQYVIASPAYHGTSRGRDFGAMVQNLIGRHKLIPDAGEKSNIFVHPAALLIFLVGTAFFKTSSQAQATENRKDMTSAQQIGQLPARSFNPFGSSEFYGQNQVEQNLTLKLLVIATAVALTESIAVMDPHLAEPLLPELRFLHEGDRGGLLSRHSLIDTSVLAEFDVAGPESNSALSMRASAHASPASQDGFSSASDIVDVVAEPNHGRWDVQTTFGGSSDFIKYAIETPHLPFLSSAHDLSVALLPLAHKLDVAQQVQKNSASNALAEPVSAPPPKSAEVPQTVSGNSDTAIKQTTAALDHPVYHENAIAVDKLPNYLTNLVPYANIAVHSDSAAGFLADNGILITFKLEAPLLSDATALLNLDAAAPGSAGGSTQHANLTSGEAVVAPTGPVADSTKTLGSDVVSKTLDWLLQETPKVQVILAHGDHDDYVFLAPPESNDATRESIIVTFDDGSAIKIVGQQQMLHDLISQVS